jgi:thiamine monophosphate kinase
MTEYDLIRRIAAQFPRSGRQANALFGCDAEVIKIGGRWWCLTMDEFSPEEDLFTSGSPETLGANLAVATLSDLLACGAKPEFFMQGFVLPKEAADRFVDGVTGGIKKVLAAADCHMCGGDLGSAQNWRFTGFAMGPAANNTPVTHNLPDGEYTLWVTGKLGDANFAALNGLPTPLFELRLDESKVIRSRAAACIDTSGGLIDALWLLHMRNPLLRFEIDLELVPFAPGISAFSRTRNIPAGAFLLGGAGEYELLFALPSDLTGPELRKMEKIGATRIGRAYRRRNPGICFLRGKTRLSEIKKAPVCPRESSTRESYIRKILASSRELFGERK